MNLSLSKLESRLDDLMRWLGTSKPCIHTIWLSTADEFWCDAQFRWIVSTDCEDEIHAFVCLWSHYLEQVEEVALDGSCSTFFLKSLIAGSGYGDEAVFAPCSAKEWHEETSEVTCGIVNAIKDARSGKRLKYGQLIQISDKSYDTGDPSTYWGIFEDGQRIPEKLGCQGLMPGELVEAIAIRLQWNNRQLFAHTTEAYVLFTWGTGA